MNTQEIELVNLENCIRQIFNKTEITKSDVETSNVLIEKWKKLTHWVEKTENPIKQ
jgi:hypothetical protein